jgi:hypothetical protein
MDTNAPNNGHGASRSRATYELCGPKRTLVAQAFTHGSFKGFREYFDQCHLLDSGESLSALWIGRYPDSENERKRVLGVPKAPHMASRRRASPAEAMWPVIRRGVPTPIGTISL